MNTLTEKQVAKMDEGELVAMAAIIKAGMKSKKAEARRQNAQPNTSKYSVSVVNHVKNVLQTVQSAVKAGDWDLVSAEALASLTLLNPDVIVAEAMKVEARNTKGRGRKLGTKLVKATAEVVDASASETSTVANPSELVELAA